MYSANILKIHHGLESKLLFGEVRIRALMKKLWDFNRYFDSIRDVGVKEFKDFLDSRPIAQLKFLYFLERGHFAFVYFLARSCYFVIVSQFIIVQSRVYLMDKGLLNLNRFFVFFVFVVISFL